MRLARIPCGDAAVSAGVPANTAERSSLRGYRLCFQRHGLPQTFFIKATGVKLDRHDNIIHKPTSQRQTRRAHMVDNLLVQLRIAATVECNSVTRYLAISWRTALSCNSAEPRGREGS